MMFPSISLVSLVSAHFSFGSPPRTSTSFVEGEKIGLLLALYNANVTTDWKKVESAARRVPIRCIVPVPSVSPPDPSWPPYFPNPEAYRSGVASLRDSGVEVYAYVHLRNISRPCCTCCGNLTQFGNWISTIKAAADFDGVSGLL